MSNADIFRKAADYIREHGWHQGSWGEDGGPRCIGGAIFSAMDHDAVTCAASPRGTCPSAITNKVLSRWLGVPPEGGLGDWNDAPERTAAEAITALEAAAFDEDLKAAAKQASELNDVEPSPSLLKEAVPV